jgi:cephalosporin-C deacetylase-like acetyl esterase
VNAPFRASLLLLFVLSCIAAAPATNQQVQVTPDHSNGIYALGELTRWNIGWKDSGEQPIRAGYVLKRDGLTILAQEALDTRWPTTLTSNLAQPGTLLLLVYADQADGKPAQSALGGVVIAPEKIEPSSPRPDDFDAFWDRKLKELAAVPANPQLQKLASGKDNVEYFKIDFDNIRGTHIHGQLAKPASGGPKFPALLIVQWAGVYGLQKNWVTDRAAEGWLALNIEPHDLPIDEPEQFYKQQFEGPLKNYWAIGNDDRDTSYYLRMYLSCYRAGEYLAQRDDWDGKTLVVLGASQGGQQSLMTAAIHPKITAAIANVPAGCDMLGPDAGRRGGFPQWYDQVQGKEPAKVHEASRYYDVVNFASRIRCPVLIGVGLIDETCPPAGIFAATNQITSPKELIVMPLSGHQNEQNSQAAFDERCWKVWLPALREGKPPPINEARRDR